MDIEDWTRAHPEEKLFGRFASIDGHTSESEGAKIAIEREYTVDGTLVSE